jgi:hypothetical protein
MTLDDLEKDLRNARHNHLTEAELESYLDQELDDISRARIEAHLKLCLICEGSLAVLKEESLTLDNQEALPEDVVLVRRAKQLLATREQPPGWNLAGGVAPSLNDRLAEYLRQAVANWRTHFLQVEPVRSAHGEGKKIWSWKSGDGVLEAHAIEEVNGSLTIRFSSNDMSFDGARLNVRLGPVDWDATMQRKSDSEVYAEVNIPQLQFPQDLEDLSIKIIS